MSRLRFPLDADAQRRIAEGSITVEDGPPDFPDSMRLLCTVDAAGGEPQLRPLFGGKVRFLPDMSLPGASPAVPADAAGFDAAAWIAAEYAGWRTVGTLVVDADPRTLALLLAALGMTSLLTREKQLPNRALYRPVRITREFLADSLVSATGLTPQTVHTGTGGAVATTAALWPAHAVAGFLTGRYGATVAAHAADAAQDQAVTKVMPAVVMDAAGVIDLAMTVAVHRERTDDGEDATLDAVAAGMAELDTARALETVNGGATLLDPMHPRNATLPARWVLAYAREHVVDAEGTDVLAEAALAPAGRVYDAFHLSAPGVPEAVHFQGILPTQRLRLEESGTGVVLQDRRVPAHGLVFVPFTIAAPPTVVLSFTEGDLRVTETDGVLDAGGGADRVTQTLASATFSPTRVALQPPLPDPANAADKAAFSAELAGLCHSLSNSEVTKAAVKARLAEYEAPLRPATGPFAAAATPVIPIFRGSLQPWALVSESELHAFFDGLQLITFDPGSPLRVRPAEAMVMWIMEGKVQATQVTITHPDGSKTTHRFLRGSWLELPGIFHTIEGFEFSQDEVDAASEADILTLVRVLLCWQWWGMDIMNVRAPNRSDNAPLLTGDLHAVMDQHRENMQGSTGTGGHLAFIRGQGINPPDMAQIENTVRLRTNDVGRWEFSIGANHIAHYVWLQHAEYLSRLPGLREAENTEPAFGYIAYNGGTATADTLWDDAAEAMAGDASLMTHSEALRSSPMTEDEQSRTPAVPVEDGDEDDGNDVFARSTAARVNGIHFAALVESYGAVFPRVI